MMHEFSKKKKKKGDNTHMMLDMLNIYQSMKQYMISGNI